MKTLPRIIATAEQLPIISQNRLGVEIICGAAGSGKTSTALLRLKSLFYMFSTRRQNQGSIVPVRALLLTFNRTLSGYVRSLATHQIPPDLRVDLEIATFGQWAMSALGYPDVQESFAETRLRSLAQPLGVLTPHYVINEVEYLLGRFKPDQIEQYVTAERTGRGVLPRVDRQFRRRILDEVVKPYQEWLIKEATLDWNGVAIRMAYDVSRMGYDIVIVDESQDFSANQLRAIRHHLADDHAITFVTDTVQRIYARGFTWAEAGYEVRSARSHVLHANHRNTRQIAMFASGILNGIGVEGDGALPNLKAAKSDGPLPVVIRGLYRKQTEWAMNYIDHRVNLEHESVAFLKHKGGGWFDCIRSHLNRRGVAFVDITREAEWPEGPENVALSTFYSAKGLEFDYVFILGLSHETTEYEDAASDDQVFVLRRLLAVAVSRARKAVVVGYKPGEESRLVDYFNVGTYRDEDV